VSRTIVIRCEDSLQHWGIKGQKWGIRRFQNEDGTRTAAGKKREAAARRETDDMTDEELRNKVNRLRNEQNYTRMVANRNKSNTPQKLRNASNMMKIGSAALEVGNAVTGGKFKDVKNIVSDTKRITDETSKLGDTISRNKEDPELKINLKKMSDAELQRRINRMMLEDQYDQMMRPQRISRGERFMTKTLPVIASTVAIAGGVASLALNINTLINGGKS
jgi:hypothetical protein